MKQPIFDEILKQFDSFLAKHNLPKEKIWVRAPHVHVVDLEDNSDIGSLHLYFPDNPVTTQDIKAIYEKAWIAPEVPLVFYVIATHNNKIVCSLLGDWPKNNTHAPGLETHNNGAIIFSCNDIWNSFTLVQDIKDWKTIKEQPECASNLDYLFQ